MVNRDFLRKSVDTLPWQDYRSNNTGMIIYYNSDPISEMAIREVPDDATSEVVQEPHYESGTFGVFGCARTKIRSAFYKGKFRYLLLMTRYAGTKADFKDKLVITGFYHVYKTAELKKLHMRYMSEYSCLDQDECKALRADEVHMVAIEDAYFITKDVLKELAFESKITRQTRIILTAEQVEKILQYLRSKPNQREQYCAETKRLMPHELVDDDSTVDAENDAA